VVEDLDGGHKSSRGKSSQGATYMRGALSRGRNNRADDYYKEEGNQSLQMQDKISRRTTTPGDQELAIF